MSPYPSPYSPPPYPQNLGYFTPYAAGDPFRAAKRAGLLMIVMGAIAVVFSMCMAGVGQMLKTTALPPEIAARMQQLEAKGISASTYFMVLGVGIFLFAMAQIFMGVFVRMAKMAAIVVSLIGTGIVLVLLGLFLLGGLMGVMNQGPEVIAGIFFWLVPLSLLVLQMKWLVAAMRANSQVTMAQQQYQAQYWQYQQNMQAYGGYGQAPTAKSAVQNPKSES